MSGEESVRVSVEIPARLWWRLATVAEQRRCRVGEVVADALLSAVGDGRRRLSPRAAVAAVEAGATQGDVAVAAGVHPRTVRGWVRDARRRRAERDAG